MSWSHSLCATCAHLRQTKNKRGSVFWMCAKAKNSPEFPKYPPQPVWRCAGFEEKVEIDLVDE